MNNFNFYNPTKVFFGKNRVSEIGYILKTYNISKILLLAGSGSIKNNGVYDDIKNSLLENDVKWVEHWGVRPNPTIEHANEGAELIKSNNLEAILAVGGGSTIDEAKAISSGLFVDNLWDIFDGNSRITEALPIFTILTLSGTGSEMNKFSVMSNDKLVKKLAAGSDLWYPKATIIDPMVQNTLPWYQTVNGGIDALSHLMELYFTGSDEESTLSIIEACMRTIVKCIDNLSENSTDYNSRANLAWTATVALSGVVHAGFVSGDWACHRIEHSVSAFHTEIAHGAGLAVVTPGWIEYVYKTKENHFLRWAKNVWGETSVMLGVEKMKKTFERWGAKLTLRELGVLGSELNDIAENACSPYKIGIVKKLDSKDVYQILQIVF